MLLPVAPVPNFAGVLDPRTAGPIAQRDAVASPLAPGLLYYATDEQIMYVYSGSQWTVLVNLGTINAQIASLEARVLDLEDHTHT